MSLNPWYVTGFVDGEGSFCVTTHGSKQQGQSVFTIQLRADDAPILKDIQQYFGCGQITYRYNDKNPNRKPQVVYGVRNMPELVRIIIPHFDAYPLQAKKRYAYRAWKEFVLMRYKLYRRHGKRERFLDMISRISDLNCNYKGQEHIETNSVGRPNVRTMAPVA